MARLAIAPIAVGDCVTRRSSMPDIEQPSFNASGPLVLFNGGVRGGVTTMYIHAYVSVPTPTGCTSRVGSREARWVRGRLRLTDRYGKGNPCKSRWIKFHAD